MIHVLEEGAKMKKKSEIKSPLLTLKFFGQEFVSKTNALLERYKKDKFFN